MIEDNKISKCITDESEVIIPDNITLINDDNEKENELNKKTKMEEISSRLENSKTKKEKTNLF